jgi:concanavalin A-like lectin/glucanase superfamily protein
VLAVVLLFSFAGCGIDAVGQAVPETPSSSPPPGPGPGPAPGPGPGPGPGPSPGPGPTPPDPMAYPKLILTESGKSLRSYWRLGEAPGGATATDSDPIQPKDGTYHGGVTLGAQGVLRLGTDPNDTAADFDGTTAYVELAYDPLVNPPADFTIEAWINPTTGPGVVVASYDVQPPRGFVLEVVQVSATVKNVQVRIGEGNQFGTVAVDLGPDTVHGGWRHVVVTHQGSGAAAVLSLYVNAAVPAQLPGVNYTSVKQNTSPPFRIGAGRDESAPGGTAAANFFKGRIDEVALYDKALDAQTIKTHFDVATTP